MTVSRLSWFLAMAFLLAAASNLSAQSTGKIPNAAYVYPAGGCRGKTFEVVVGGQHMAPPDARKGLDYEVVISGARAKEAAKVFVSGGGVTAEVVSWYRPMTQGESVRISIQSMAKMEEVEKKEGRKITREEAYKLLGVTEEHLEERAKYQKRRADRRRQPNPQLDEQLTVRIHLAPDAEFGGRELRVVTPAGMSNPLWFYVGQWPETYEKEPNDIKPDPSVKVQLPMVINGQILPGDADRFVFEAKRGTKLVAHCAARKLVPYLADAVPGWFQAMLHLYDEEGRQVAFADSLGFRHDPVLYYEVPKDGKYVIEVHDSIYRGREDFPYRISIGEIPYITGLFPLGGRTGEPCTVEVHGWNLPVESLRMKPSSDRGRTIHPVVLERDNIFSNRVGFIVDNLPEVMERESNDTPEAAQEVGSPVAINGRIDRPGDVDFFKFDHSGAIVAEVYARRLYSPLDSVVCLTDSRGRVAAYNDDYEDKSWPLITHHADSRLLTSTKGAHYISISDAQGRGGADYAYRLYIRSPRPDFDLRVAPSSVTARAGTCVPISMHAIRKDGFDGDIALELENPPPGFALSGAWVPGGQDHVHLTLTVPPEASTEPFSLGINGYATSRGRRISRPAFPVEETTQAFILQHLVPTKDWTLFVMGKPPGKPPCKFLDTGLKLPAGGTGQLRVLVNQAQVAGELRFELSKPPKGITLEDPVVAGTRLAVPIKCDREKVKPGLKGNLLFIVSRERVIPPKEKDQKPKTSRYVVGLFPAVPFEVVRR